MGLLKQLTKDLMTGPDGVTYAIGRVLAALGFVTGHAAFGFALFKNAHIDKTPVDLTALGLGLAALYGGLAALIYGTNKTEPQGEK